MNKITVSAKTVSDAITEASIELGVTSSSLEYEVIEKGSAGFLGIGAKQAVITAWKKSDKTDKPAKKDAPKKEEPKKVEKVEEIPTISEEVEEVSEKEEKLAEVEPQTKEACEKFLRDVLKTMGMEVTLTSEIDEDGALAINMEGDNMGILIGKRGQTLDSLQY